MRLLTVSPPDGYNLTVLPPSELARLRDRCPDSVAAVIREHSGPLYRAALGLGLSPADAEDLVQDALAAFFEGLGRFEGRSSVRTYLFGILYNKARRRWEKGWREQAVDPVDAVFESRFDATGTLRRLDGPEDTALNGELAALIADCSNGLTQAQRAAFHLKEVERLSTPEICKTLEVTETHLGVLLFRARNKLRECLEKKWDSSL